MCTHHPCVSASFPRAGCHSSACSGTKGRANLLRASSPAWARGSAERIPLSVICPTNLDAKKNRRMVYGRTDHVIRRLAAFSVAEEQRKAFRIPFTIPDALRTDLCKETCVRRRGIRQCRRGGCESFLTGHFFSQMAWRFALSSAFFSSFSRLCQSVSEMDLKQVAEHACAGTGAGRNLTAPE